jgi:hypothetical protein
MICLIIVLLCASRMLQSKIMLSDVCCPSLHGQIGSSASLNLCKYALVIPCPVKSAVNSGVIGGPCSYSGAGGVGDNVSAIDDDDVYSTVSSQMSSGNRSVTLRSEFGHF